MSPHVHHIQSHDTSEKTDMALVYTHMLNLSQGTCIYSTLPHSLCTPNTPQSPLRLSYSRGLFPFATKYSILNHL